MRSKKRRRILHGLCFFSWIMATYLGYATLDGLILLERDSKAANVQPVMIVDTFLTMIFAGLGMSFLFVIGSLRNRLSQDHEHSPELEWLRVRLRSSR